MKCLVCQGLEIVPQTAKEAIPVGEDLIYVSIKIPVCQTCGERYYDRKTMRYLEQVEEELRAGHGELRQVGKLLAYG
ncbi:MAG: YgiT-type zinc finger protein [Gemmatimonadales bacterium]|jgi:YgiT-type zinc finger domain-containing protein